MFTPVITKRQQNQSLASAKKSAKKTPAKGLRNVLAQPFEKYWPVVSAEDGSTLEGFLNALLPGLKRRSRSIPWAMLRKMDKEERLAAQKKSRDESQSDGDDSAALKSVTIGVNAVTRDLEKENLCSVLLDSNVESLLVKHIVSMAQRKSIPILLVPFLKKITLEHIGFASAAMGLKKTAVDTGSCFGGIYREIVKLSEAIPLPKEISFNADPEVSPTIEDDRMSVEDENTREKLPFTLPTNIYKYRNSRKERSFVPPKSTDQSVDNKNEWSDFIAIGNDEFTPNIGKPLFSRKNRRYVDVHAEDAGEPAEETAKSEEFISLGGDDVENVAQRPKKRKTDDSAYVSLKVKRIQGNNNRVKATKAAKPKKKVAK